MKKLIYIVFLIAMVLCIITPSKKVIAKSDPLMKTTGSTNVQFNLGYVTDSTAGWAVSYPAMVILGDGYTDKDNTAKIDFSMWNTASNGEEPSEKYNGDKEVAIKIVGDISANSDGTVKMGAYTQDSKGTVNLQFLTDSLKDITVPQNVNSLSESIATLSAGKTDSTANVYIKNKDNVKINDAYLAPIIWDVTTVNNN